MPIDPLQAAAIGAILALLIAVLPGLPSRFLCGYFITLGIALAFNAYTFERTFGAYVYDGTPVVGWPRIFATGQSGGRLSPTPLPPPDFHVHNDPYWLQRDELRADVLACLAVACLGGGLFARRCLGSTCSRHWIRHAAVWFLRSAVLGTAAAGILHNRYWHTDYSMAGHFSDGTPLDRTVLWLLTLMLLMPIVFPAGCPAIPSLGRVLHSRSRFRVSGTRAIATAAIAWTLSFALLKASAAVGSWQHHYLNLPTTFSLLAVSAALLIIGPIADRDADEA